MVENLENPIGTILIFLGFLLLAGVYQFLKILVQIYKARRKARQRKEDDMILAYLAWLQEQDLQMRQERMAQARKQSTPSFQDFDLSSLSQKRDKLLVKHG